MRPSKRASLRGLVVLAATLIVSCTQAIRERAPSYTTTAKQNALEFRDCVAEVIGDQFGSQYINKFSNGIVLGANISVLIEQVEGRIYVYDSDDSFSDGQLHIKAADFCNENPKLLTSIRAPKDS